ncbi:iron complex transport system ATP-binding protein [Thalassobacillus cyri]|uniref:Iron complex transport system ATP-binding protein n=1 Tax=Thalassobacillus cyri TaxID=571932 RepID=A0A1H3ZTE5_9BACI|nr:ABC transporter ATP-binding protein [Thalassobacillus cyri]SEA26885.1 iron complex transport system ATP-binding protein [Thalassobacillus cyri]
MSEQIISLKGIEWKQKDKTILKDITWNVEKGEHWALLGLNGSGKTSLLNMIIGYQWPTNGEVTVLDRRFGETNILELRKSIGWVSTSLDERFKHHGGETASEVVLSGKHATIGIYDEITAEDINRANHLLQQFRIGHLAGQKFSSLSQGEKRKTMIARAWMASPELLILDEPCSGLDILSREELLQTIDQMNHSADGPTLIYVTHHTEEVIPSISHALLLHSGRIVASGEKHRTLTEGSLQETLELPLALEWDNGRPWIRVQSHNINPSIDFNNSY